MATHFQPRGPRPAERPPREDTATLNVDDIRFGEKPDPRLFAEIAEEKAAHVATSGGGETNKSTQLRRFYDELVMWQEKVGASDERFAELQPYICMLKAKVAYARGRKPPLVDLNFEKMLRRVIDQCTNAATLRQAKLFLEAFMAFYKVHNK